MHGGSTKLRLDNDMIFLYVISFVLLFMTFVHCFLLLIRRDRTSSMATTVFSGTASEKRKKITFNIGNEAHHNIEK